MLYLLIPKHPLTIQSTVFLLAGLYRLLHGLKRKKKTGWSKKQKARLALPALPLRDFAVPLKSAALPRLHVDISKAGLKIQFHKMSV